MTQITAKGRELASKLDVNQREKDRVKAQEYADIRDATRDPIDAYADGAEYGRKDQAAQIAAEQAAPLAKLERLLRAGWVLEVKPGAGVCLCLPPVLFEDVISGATLAEALEQIP